MYVEGIVVDIDNDNLKVKLKLPDYDDFITEWLCVPQKFCAGNKSRNSLPKVNSLAAAVLSEDMSHGALLGAIYNDEDTLAQDINSNDYIKFEDGSSISHNEDEGGFLVVKNLKVQGDIICSGDVSDKKGTMQKIRDDYDSHKHPNGNNGSPTGIPDIQM